MPVGIKNALPKVLLDALSTKNEEEGSALGPPYTFWEAALGNDRSDLE